MVVEAITSLMLYYQAIEHNYNNYNIERTVSVSDSENERQYLDYLQKFEKMVNEDKERLRMEQEYEKQRQEQAKITYTHNNYRQTYYSVHEGEVSLGSGYNKNSKEVKSINNVMNFYDSEYGYLPIVAININEVLASGLNSKGTPNLYGSVIEMKYPNGQVNKAIILDACGACSRASKIDLWVYANDQKLDIKGVEFRYIRHGW